MTEKPRNPDGSFARVHSPWSLENFDDGFVDSQGRFFVYFPGHPRAHKSGYMLRSIATYEAHHSVKVNRNHAIHHIDGNQLNDSKENLELKPLRGSESHASHHHSREDNPNWGRFGEKNPLWKGDSISPFSKYQRALAVKKRAVADGRLTPEIEAEYERAKIEARPHNAKYMREWRAKRVTV